MSPVFAIQAAGLDLKDLRDLLEGYGGVVVGREVREYAIRNFIGDRFENLQYL